MCMGGGGGQPQAVTPAAAPAPAAPAPQETQIGAARAAEDKGLFGSITPSTRSDRSLNVSGGGSGLGM